MQKSIQNTHAPKYSSVSADSLLQWIKVWRTFPLLTSQMLPSKHQRAVPLWSTLRRVFNDRKRQYVTMWQFGCFFTYKQRLGPWFSVFSRRERLWNKVKTWNREKNKHAARAGASASPARAVGARASSYHLPCDGHELLPSHSTETRARQQRNNTTASPLMILTADRSGRMATDNSGELNNSLDKKLQKNEKKKTIKTQITLKLIS